jgi:hypothetical protein
VHTLKNGVISQMRQPQPERYPQYAPETAMEPPRRKRLFVQVPTKDHQTVTKIRQYLVMFPGSDQLVLCCADTKKRFGIACMVHPSLERALKELLGEENVVLR